MSIIESPSVSPVFSVEGLSEPVAVGANAELTVAQVAAYLRTTEKHVGKFLASGRLPSRRENGKQLVSHKDLLEFEEERKRRNAAIDRMMLDNIEMGLYDDF